jgi:hypothetical protein
LKLLLFRLISNVWPQLKSDRAGRTTIFAAVSLKHNNAMLQLGNGGTMKKYGYCKSMCAAVLIVGLTACANNGEDVSERPLPSYASPFITPQGLNTWTVRCPLQTITGLDDRDTSMFYKSNGMTKTLGEFCEEHDSSSRIPGPAENN